MLRSFLLALTILRIGMPIIFKFFTSLTAITLVFLVIGGLFSSLQLFYFTSHALFRDRVFALMAAWISIWNAMRFC